MLTWNRVKARLDANAAGQHAIGQQHVLELDGLRGVSVLVILLFHFGVKSISGGYVGVDVFFVLSGYLITSNILAELNRGEFSLARFYYRRIRRLLPAFLATLALTLLFSVLLLAPPHLERLARVSVYSVFSLSNFFFLGEAGYFDTSSAFKPLLHFWSLAVEEQFYLVWPTMMLLFFLWLGRRALFSVYVIIFFSSLIAAEITLNSQPEFAFYFMPLRAYEFALGACCVSLRETSAVFPRPLRAILAALGIMLILYCSLTFDENSRFPGLNALLPCSGAVIIILFGDAGLTGKLLRARQMVYLGTISYSVYLVHWPMVTLFTYWTARQLNTADTIFLTTFSLIAGSALYHGIEARFRIGKVIAPAHSYVRFFSGLCLSAGFILVMSVGIWWDNGLWWRLDPVIVERHLESEYEDSCLSWSPPADVGDFCRVGADSRTAEKTRILILGDSHAAHLRAGLDYIGKKHSIRFDFWTFPGCPPLRGTFKRYGTVEDINEELCRVRVSPLWEEAIESGDYDVVILASRWMWLFEPQDYAGTEIRRDILLDRDNPIADIGVARQLFRERLKETVASIHAAGARAVVFSQVPLLARNIQYCETVPMLTFSEARRNARCSSSVERGEALARLRYTDEVIGDIAGQNALPVIFSKYFCENPDQFCLTVIDGRPLYMDDNHLNHVGSLFAAKHFEKVFIDFLRSR